MDKAKLASGIRFRANPPSHPLFLSQHAFHQMQLCAWDAWPACSSCRDVHRALNPSHLDFVWCGVAGFGGPG